MEWGTEKQSVVPGLQEGFRGDCGSAAWIHPVGLPRACPLGLCSVDVFFPAPIHTLPTNQTILPTRGAYAHSYQERDRDGKGDAAEEDPRVKERERESLTKRNADDTNISDLVNLQLMVGFSQLVNTPVLSIVVARTFTCSQ